MSIITRSCLHDGVSAGLAPKNQQRSCCTAGCGAVFTSISSLFWGAVSKLKESCQGKREKALEGALLHPSLESACSASLTSRPEELHSLDLRVEGKEPEEEYSSFAEALLVGDLDEAVGRLDRSKPLTLRELWLKGVVDRNLSFRDVEFLQLRPKLQREIYSVANVFGSEELVERLNRLGMAEEVELLGPAIFAPNMDCVRVRKALLEFLKGLRAEGRLCSRAEFEQREDASEYMEKRSIGRILGRDFAASKARQLHLTRVKLPQKFAVVDNRDELSFTLNQYTLEPESQNVKIYAKRIEPVERFLTREECLELITLFEEIFYEDIHRGNFILAADGVYLIDTEYEDFLARPKSLARGEYLGHDKFEQIFQDLMDPSDRSWMMEQVAARKRAFIRTDDLQFQDEREMFSRRRDQQLDAFGFSFRKGVIRLESSSIL